MLGDVSLGVVFDNSNSTVVEEVDTSVLMGVIRNSSLTAALYSPALEDAGGGNASVSPDLCGSVDAFGAAAVINTTYFIGGERVHQRKEQKKCTFSV